MTLKLKLLYYLILLDKAWDDKEILLQYLSYLISSGKAICSQKEICDMIISDLYEIPRKKQCDLK
jgi:hypothetical protein